MLAQKWNAQDEELSKILFALSESFSSPQTIELGEVQFAQHEGRIIGVPGDFRYGSVDGPPWLLLVPSLTIDEESNDFRSPHGADILSAIQILQAHRRASVTAHLRIQVHPQDDELLSMPNFSLELEFVASIVLPTALEPVVHKKGMLKKDFVALEDSRRRLLRAAYLPEGIISTDVNDPITVSTFYSIMSSAPSLPSQQAIDALQPENLLPTLLPFQRRSVAWLLEKEGMSITAEGTIVPRENSSSFSFWEEVMEGNRRWFLNRLSGELSEDEPQLPTILGGMLAEEPGLGKTVETIALILLNPAPPEWNPSLSRWDPISRLDVKAVKVCFCCFRFIILANLLF
jgi:E3 ubiquitin-protein ligase SHPRH